MNSINSFHSFFKKSGRMAGIILLLCSVFSLTACSGNKRNLFPDNDIHVLFTGDLNCEIDGVLSYPNVAALKKELLASTPYVTLVDLGDAVQGELIGTVSKGLYITQLMNSAGYDYAVIGNHEFDFGLKNFSRILSFSNAKYLNTNVTYTGHETDYLEATYPYDIVSYGNVKIAYLGISSPLSVKSSTPAYFMENGKFVYNFCEGKKGSRLYSKIQKTTDKARKEGADYVIALSHLGIKENNEVEKMFNIVSLINHTKGIDAVIDAHDPSNLVTRYERNILGEEVLLSGSGSNFDAIGHLVISTKGKITSEQICKYTKKDASVENELALLEERMKDELNTVAAHSNIKLSTTNENGVRLVRIRETPIGNLCADAYRTIAQADIGLVNGGGIRNSLPEGDITNADIINIHPFNNKLCVRKVKGQQILDCLEFAAKNVTSEIEKDGKAVGEFGGFLQVSGLKFTIHTSLPTPITVDAKGIMSDIHGYRRVKDVQILRNGNYVNLDPKASYTVATVDYILKNRGDGNTTLLDGELLQDNLLIDNQALIYYISDILGGDVGSRYSTTENRITVK